MAFGTWSRAGKSDNRTLLAVFAVAVIVVGVITASVIFRGEAPEAPSPDPEPVVEAPEPPPAEPEPEPEAPVVQVPPEDVVMEELRYLPEGVSLAERGASPMLSGQDFPRGDRRLQNVRALTDPDQHGEFLSPRFSPDGLQILASRPGYSGIYLLNADGGEPVRIADGNGFRARWTSDGRIRIENSDGTIDYYSADGTLLAAGQDESESRPAWSRDDAIYVRGEEGGSGRLLAAGDDRYFNPVISPDGEWIVYEGLLTGVHMQRVDGSEEPIHLGAGNNPTWANDGSAVLFDQTSDDGHDLTGGDIIYHATDGSEQSNLTEDRGEIARQPSIHPSGGQVAFESDGVLYLGDM